MGQKFKVLSSQLRPEQLIVDNEDSFLTQSISFSQGNSVELLSSFTNETDAQQERRISLRSLTDFATAQPVILPSREPPVGRICRICRLPAAADGEQQQQQQQEKLISPCRCLGDRWQYVHRHCIGEGLSKGTNWSCEICSTAYVVERRLRKPTKVSLSPCDPCMRYGYITINIIINIGISPVTRASWCS